MYSLILIPQNIIIGIDASKKNLKELRKLHHWKKSECAICETAPAKADARAVLQDYYGLKLPIREAELLRDELTDLEFALNPIQQKRIRALQIALQFSEEKDDAEILKRAIPIMQKNSERVLSKEKSSNLAVSLALTNDIFQCSPNEYIEIIHQDNLRLERQRESLEMRNLYRQKLDDIRS